MRRASFCFARGINRAYFLHNSTLQQMCFKKKSVGALLFHNQTKDRKTKISPCRPFSCTLVQPLVSSHCKSKHSFDFFFLIQVPQKLMIFLLKIPSPRITGYISLFSVSFRKELCFNQAAWQPFGYRMNACF